MARTRHVNKRKRALMIKLTLTTDSIIALYYTFHVLFPYFVQKWYVQHGLLLLVVTGARPICIYKLLFHAISCYHW